MKGMIHSPDAINREPTWLEVEASKEHPIWHYCRKCASFTKTVVLFLILNALADFATFKPIHTFYEHMGWIK